jgi:phospholipase C
MWDCTWSTMPEILEDAGVSWKVYSPSNGDVSGKYASLRNYPSWDPDLYNPTRTPEVMGISDHILPYFTAFRDPTSALYNKAFEQTLPNQFVADVQSGKLPSVSWIIPPLGFDEHPSASSVNGMYFTSLVLDALASNRKVWSRTAFFLMYDENDGWFDHVKPPTPPPGTADEYLTTSTFPSGEPNPATLNIAGPLGLGVRVPMLVISPFSRGGHIATEVFDHTSQLKLVSKRFGVELPNVSHWRGRKVGDLTSTMFHSRKRTELPRLPRTSVLLPSSGPCSAIGQELDHGGTGPSVPTKQRMPRQGGGSRSASHYFKMTEEARAIADDHRTVVVPDGPRPMTTKSSYNRLAKVPG